MRGEQISRQWRLLRLLSERPGGVSAKELADELSISVRTLYRDLDLLERIGIALMQDREGREVTWRLLEPRKLHLGPTYSPAELTALRHACRALRARGALEHAEQVESVISKVESTLPRRILLAADDAEA